MFKSTKAVIALSCCLVFVMTLFMSVGYATVFETLSITGSAGFQEEPALIYITEVKYISHAGRVTVTGTPQFSKVGEYLTTIKHNDFTLNYQRGSGTQNAGGSVTFEVTVRNNSGVDQYFSGYVTDPSFPSDRNCSHKIDYTGITLGDRLGHGDVKTFRITVQNTGTIQNSDIAYKNRIGKINFTPDYKDKFTPQAIRNIATIFSDVLNGKGIDGEGMGIDDQGEYIAGDQILSHIKSDYMNIHGDGGGTGAYIGNVAGADASIHALMESIFGDNMIIKIGNLYYTVSFLMKNQRINHANDMVLYFTPDPLLLGGGSWNGGTHEETSEYYKDLNMVPVYALVFTYDANTNTYSSPVDEKGEWFIFSGEAPVCDIGGGMGAENIGNFNTNIWNSLDYPNLHDTSGGSVSSGGNSKNGELDEAYKAYIGGQKPVTSN